MKSYRIARALPGQKRLSGQGAEFAFRRVRPSVYACGDYLDTASINGALRSGRIAAETIIADLGAQGQARVKTA